MIIIGIALAAGAAIIGWGSRASKGASLIFDGLAVIALFLFFVIAAAAVMGTIADDTVFMTEVHKVLINPLFLASGAYLGPYTIAKIAFPL